MCCAPRNAICFVFVQLLSHVQLFVTPGLQHTRLFSNSPSPRVCSNSCPLSWSCHPTIPSSVILSHLLILPLPSIFQHRAFSNEPALCTRWPNIWASASASVLPMSIQDWFPLELAGLISLQSKGLSKVFFSPTIRKYQFFSSQPSLGPSSHLYMTTGKTVALTIWTSAKWCLCFLNHCLGLSQLSPQGASVF